MLIKKLYQEIETDFSLKVAYKWDYSGHQYGSKNHFVAKIMVCLDLTSEVITAAIAKQINVIITHHPFCFGKKKRIQRIPYKQTIIELLNKHQIAVYALHTNYDGLMNELILQELNTQKIVAFDDNLTKIGHISLTADEIIMKLKAIFKITTVQHNLPTLDQPIKTVALAAGAAGNVIANIDQNIDLFITGEVKWDQWVLANEKQLAVICFNHYMEDFFTAAFAGYLTRKFPTLTIIPYHIKNIINYR
ncbi:Nif3-like dinuclear metal center hexameric protein [Spiroplasma citri]|uniref:GTP cyclohydrolase 1 type 2 homolog n=1 Tax=Spiroplasma citri TaxID=2133 RepID=A0AAX3T0B0_SPICI|nr:Nif3-like dinuclear metal center hexameric protein [Spiroplasma citri]WFG96907.1 Nif3-like dinuclear metal center hexameric protein [Spiroplasma citri]WFH00805.1 Nif3-like dinuclear metal center hexameric protein [Spiroplasma citri]